jgi:tripartite-type tricarboxylate transporter receptor subunit TctC
LAKAGYVLVANPSVPANNVAELIALAKSKPGALSIASAGNGTLNHLIGEMLQKATDIQLQHIPYKAAAAAATDVAGGQVPLSVQSMPSSIALIRSGKLKVLGVTTDKRQLSMPDVPTIDEAGVPGYFANNWYCFVGPAGMPKDIVAVLNREFRNAMLDPKVMSTLSGQGMVPEPSSPEQLTKFISQEIDKWGKIVRARNIKPD